MADELKSRMNLLVSSFAERNPHRVVNRDYKDIHAIESEDDLKAGVITFVTQSEGDYESTFNKRAENSTQKVVMVARTYLSEDACGQDVEDEEFKMLDEIKTLVRATDLPAELCNLTLKHVQTSAQMETPLAWIIADLEITD